MYQNENNNYTHIKEELLKRLKEVEGLLINILVPYTPDYFYFLDYIKLNIN